MNSTYRSLLVVLLLVSFFGGCRSSKEVADGHPSVNPSAESATVDYSLIYVIHGDANYLYHNQSGKSLQADEEQLKEAVEIAQEAKHGEVFIFHQQPESKILWLFPKKDRRFIYYRNGKRLHESNYSPTSEEQVFAKEQQLYKKYKSQDSARTFFLYFGHEIPEQKETSYFQSRPEASFTADSFTRGEASFLEGDQRFDLTVLSTCDNGTPAMVSKQRALTDYLLASPQNLHLSHIDSKGLLALEQRPDISSSKLGKILAEDTFNRLDQFLQTVITLSVYDMQKIDSYFPELAEKYQHYKHTESRHQFEKENKDCASFLFRDFENVQKGVTVYFKAPRFGRHTDQKAHSGWGCQP